MLPLDSTLRVSSLHAALVVAALPATPAGFRLGGGPSNPPSSNSPPGAAILRI